MNDLGQLVEREGLLEHVDVGAVAERVCPLPQCGEITGADDGGNDIEDRSSAHIAPGPGPDAQAGGDVEVNDHQVGPGLGQLHQAGFRGSDSAHFVAEPVGQHRSHHLDEVGIVVDDSDPRQIAFLRANA
jgi:hypothetical protein